MDVWDGSLVNKAVTIHDQLIENSFFLQSISSYMGEEKLQTFINFALKAMSEITLPCKRLVFHQQQFFFFFHLLSCFSFVSKPPLLRQLWLLPTILPTLCNIAGFFVRCHYSFTSIYENELL